MVDVTYRNGKLLFTSDGTDFSITGMGNAQLLGLSNDTVHAIKPSANISAVEQGSEVTLNSTGNNGGLEIGGSVKSYRRIHLSGNDIEIAVGASLETINDSIEMNAGKTGVVKGDLIAGGPGSDVRLQAATSLTLSGDIVASDLI